MIIETYPTRFCRIHSAPEMLRLYQAWEAGEYRDVVGIYVFDDVYSDSYLFPVPHKIINKLTEYEDKIMFIHNDIYTGRGENSIRYGGEIIQIQGLD